LGSNVVDCLPKGTAMLESSAISKIELLVLAKIGSHELDLLPLDRCFRHGLAFLILFKFFSSESPWNILVGVSGKGLCKAEINLRQCNCELSLICKSEQKIDQKMIN
jgi:hypothetical protein